MSIPTPQSGKQLTACDLALEDAMLENLELRDSLRAYRELAQAAIHAVHDSQADLDRLRTLHHQLLDEHRALRQQLVAREAA